MCYWEVKTTNPARAYAVIHHAGTDEVLAKANFATMIDRIAVGCTVTLFKDRQPVKSYTRDE